MHELDAVACGIALVEINLAEFRFALPEILILAQLAERFGNVPLYGVPEEVDQHEECQFQIERVVELDAQAVEVAGVGVDDVADVDFDAVTFFDVALDAVVGGLEIDHGPWLRLPTL